MKKAVVTGAAGFAGYSLTSHLIEHGYKVYAIVRPGSKHNGRLRVNNIQNTLAIEKKRGVFSDYANIISRDISNDYVVVMEVDSGEYNKLPEIIKEKCDVYFHLAWAGRRNEYEEQYKNISQAVTALEAAGELGCKRFICTGSQAEYGVQSGLITEDLMPKPIYAYGAAKIAAMYLTKTRAEQLGIEWIWGRIFSLYGLYEPAGRMLPDLINNLRNGETANLSDCSQNWDYLDAGDAAEAIIALGERGHSGEIYNIANGDYHPLKDFVRIMEETYSNGGTVVYGDRANPYISLSPSVEKITKDTGWEPRVKFLQDYESIRGLE